MAALHTDADYRAYRKNAASGSRKLKSAILRSLGHAVPHAPRGRRAPPPHLRPHPLGRPKRPPNAERMKAVQLAASKVCRVRLGNLLGRRVIRRFVRARQLAMWVARDELDASFPEIGKYFDRDHTTVLYGCREIQKLIDANDRSTILKINAIRARLV
jgi:hypothetical protein